MPMFDEPKILHTREFREEFYRCMSRNPDRLRMAVPYITGIPGWEKPSQFSLHVAGNGCELSIVTGEPGGSGGVLSKEQADLMLAHGVNLRIRTSPFLHAKIYQFVFPMGHRVAFVGSANFTMGGFTKNDEIVAFFSKKSDNDGVARQFERLEAGGIDYHHWKVKEAV